MTGRQQPYRVLFVTNDSFAAENISRDLGEDFLVELPYFAEGHMYFPRNGWDAVLVDDKIDIYAAIGVRHMTGRPVIPLTLGLDSEKYNGWVSGTFEKPITMPYDPKVLLETVLKSIRNAPQIPSALPTAPSPLQ